MVIRCIAARLTIHDWWKIAIHNLQDVYVWLKKKQTMWKSHAYHCCRPHVLSTSATSVCMYACVHLRTRNYEIGNIDVSRVSWHVHPVLYAPATVFFFSSGILPTDRNRRNNYFLVVGVLTDYEIRESMRTIVQSPRSSTLHSEQGITNVYL